MTPPPYQPERSNLTLAQAREALAEHSDPERVVTLEKFFKAAPGEYGEGDRFLGLRVPQVRRIARTCQSLTDESIRALLTSQWHEERLLALLVMVDRYRRGDQSERGKLHRMYLDNRLHVNSWDLVDASAEHLLGSHLSPSDLSVLEDLARSGSLWDRRMAVIATFGWVKQGAIGPTLHLAELLRDDRQDLIQKAVGWMLREAWKRKPEEVERFLRLNQRTMPRTMLRYAIERLPEPRRQHFLRGEA